MLVPILFNTFLTGVSYLLKEEMERLSICVRYRLDRSLFDLQKLKSRTKTSDINIIELQYADDCALLANSEEDLHMLLDRVNMFYGKFGLKLSTEKTEIMYSQIDGRRNVSIDVNGAALKSVDSFKYLGSYLSADCSLDKEIENRVARASASFGRFRSRVFLNRSLKLSTRVRVYNAICYMSFQLALWCQNLGNIPAPCEKTKKYIYNFGSLRKLLGVTWRDKLTYTEIFSRTGSCSMETLLAQRQLRWTGHVCRMSGERRPKQILYGELDVGKRMAGCQRKRYKDDLKRTLQKCDIQPDQLELLVVDRPGWRDVCVRGLACCEERRERRREAARAHRHQRALQPPATDDQYGVPYGKDVVYPELDYSDIAEHMRDVSKPSSSKSKDSHKQEVIITEIHFFSL